MHPIKPFVWILCSLALAACGGGGGSGGGSTPSSVPVQSSSVQVSSSSETSVSSIDASSSSSSEDNTSSQSTVSSSSSDVAVSSSSNESSESSSSLPVPSSSSVSSEDTSSSDTASSASSSDSSGAGESSSQSSSSESSSSASSLDASITSLIVVDQFGYLPNSRKIAVLRDPQTGYDASQSLTPGASIQLVNLDSGISVYAAAPQAWNSGATSTASGDRVWWFDFSSITAPGRYTVLDAANNVRSPAFTIGNDIYKPVLKHAFRTFFYQRAGFAKQLPYAETGWTDAASHIGPGQDRNARRYNATGDASTERDLSGGWYDAGDYNKYTNWHADYLIGMLHMYLENPAVWTDDFNILESGNGLPDLIDEIKWGFDWLIRMQEANGSVLSVMGLSHASPPSSASGPSYYGPATTAATLSSAAAFAFGSKVFAQLGNPALEAYASDLRERAEAAWAWADLNPSVTFYNSGTIAAGEQEVNNSGRAEKKLSAAIYLFADTGEDVYKNFVEANIPGISWVGPWNEPQLTSFLYYASLPGVASATANSIRTGYGNAMNSGENWQAVNNATDAYRAFLGDQNFTWGSNRTMARKGITFYNLLSYSIAGADATQVRNAALGYLNYLHGTNPQGIVYLSNMYSLSVHSSVNEFYHSWFANNSPLWDRVGVSTYGPAPGFLVGGPNPGYNWDGCCPASCGSVANNNVCTSISVTPPRGQPPMKSYLDFNTSWPLNSWEVTENHNDYQVSYIRLLSKFVNP